MATTAIQTKWIDTNSKYVETQFTWGDIITAKEVVSVFRGFGPGAAIPWKEWQEREEKKKRKLIKLLCKINGDVFEEENEYKDIQLSVDDARLIVKKVLGVELNVLNETITLGDKHV